MEATVGTLNVAAVKLSRLFVIENGDFTENCAELRLEFHTDTVSEGAFVLAAYERACEAFSQALTSKE